MTAQIAGHLARRCRASCQDPELRFLDPPIVAGRHTASGHRRIADYTRRLIFASSRGKSRQAAEDWATCLDFAVFGRTRVLSIGFILSAS